MLASGISSVSLSTVQMWYFVSPRSSVFCILLEPFSGLLNSSAGCRRLLYPNHPPTIEVAAPLGANMSSFFVLHPRCHLHSKTQLCCFPSDRLPAYAHCVIGQDDGAQYGEVPGPGSAEGCGPTAAARSGDHRLHFGQGEIPRPGAGPDSTGQDGGWHCQLMGQLQQL